MGDVTWDGLSQNIFQMIEGTFTQPCFQLNMENLNAAHLHKNSVLI